MKRIRRFIAASLAAGLLFAGMAVQVAEPLPAAAAQTMYVKGYGVRVRSGPGTDTAVAGVRDEGDTVTVLEISNGWAKTEGGYIRMDFLTETPPTTRAAAAGSSGSNSAAAAGAAASQTAASGLPEGVTAETVALTENLRFAQFSKIHSGTAILYRNTKGAHGSIVICVNAGHGTKGGTSVKTLSHPDGTGKVTGGTNANGAVESTAVSTGMDFSDGTPEKTVTLKEAQLLRAKLLSRGYSVLMIREGEDVQLDNIARTVLANSYADCHIAIHWDSTTSNKGAFFMSVPDALKYLDPVSYTWEKSEAFGRALISGLKGRGVKIFGDGSMDMDLTQTSYSSVPGVDIELGDKVSDHSQAALDNIAEGLADGIEAYFR